MHSRDDSRMLYSRAIGALFLLGFLGYGFGNAITTSVLGRADVLSTLYVLQTTLVFGAVLMLLNTAVDVGKGVLFFPILERHGKRTALTYLSALIVQVVLMDVGVLGLLMMVPLSEYVRDAGASEAWANALAGVLIASNTTAYQIGQATLAGGALFMSALLYRTRLIPTFLAGLGVIGYATHLTGAVAELFGIHISLILLIPGGLFELGLAFWLLVKGFEPSAYGQRDEMVTPIMRRAETMA